MKINELILITENLKETKNFYHEILGLTIIVDDEKTISFKVGQSKLTFFEKNNEQKPFYHFAFNIPTQKIDEAIEFLSPKIGLIQSENEIVTNFENWKAKAIFFYDNNNNILEFIERDDLRVCIDEKFDISKIISISEIGIVHDEPLKIADELIEKTGIEYFTKGPRREDFAALGNEEGLFVISKPSRNWYPTKVNAQKHYLRAKVNVDDVKHEIEFE